MRVDPLGIDPAGVNPAGVETQATVNYKNVLRYYTSLTHNY